MKHRLRRPSAFEGHFLLLTFLIALLAAAVLFVPFIIYNGGVFYYYGDFNVQEIPFYQLVHSQVRSGELGWNHLTDLGTDTIASYSFYLLGSPFFWVTIPFPNEFVPYLIGPLLILKFACAAATAYIYLRRYVSYNGYALLGGLAYAFSGFSIYNVFFFHFHEPMIVFPLLLAALDAFLYDKKRCVFALAVFAACVVNYYFFVGQALFVVMYYLMLTLTQTYRFQIKEFLLLAAEVVIGFCGTAFILLPSVIGLMGNPRLDSMPNGWEALVYDRPQRYWLIILSFLFPADMPAYPTFTPESNCKWASVAGWLPLFSMTGVIAYLQLKKRDWLKKLLALLALFALIPALNSMFQLMNSSIFYTRWFYMPVLMSALATIRAFEDEKVDWNRAIIWCSCITLGASLLIGFMPKMTEDAETGGELFELGVQADVSRFWIYALMALISLLAFVLVYKKFFTDKRRFVAASAAALLAVAYVSSFFIIGSGTLYSGTTEVIKEDIINSRDDIAIDDLESVRSDFYKATDNTAMFWRVPGINCFQSSVSTSIMQFYNAVGITRDVASRPDYSAYSLRPFLSTKYFFDYNKDNDDKESEKSFIDKQGNTKMPNWTYLKTCNNFDIYENENYIPMGFCFDSYITEEEFERVKKQNKTDALLYAMVLSKEQMRKYADITGWDESYETLYGDSPDSFESAVDSYTYGKAQYTAACKKLSSRSCDSFEYTKSGFTAQYDNFGKAKLLFFTVPYSTGFSAEVNGEPVEIEKADFGFMAVKIPSNTNCKIEFTYQTPGLKSGAAISLLALFAFAAYAAAVIIIKKHHQEKQHVIWK